MTWDIRPALRRRATVMVAALGVCALSLTALADARSDPPPAVGEMVARLELAAPNATSFVLRGTVPVPRGVFPRDDGLNPFILRNVDAVRFAAQVEVVSRYPGPGADADVVELLSRVTLPRGVEYGDTVGFDVVYWPHPEQPFSQHPEVDALFDEAHGFVLRTHDVFGHLYNARPLVNLRDGVRRRTLRSGAAAVQEVTHTTLLPRPFVEGDQGTLPHMMGVHVYVTRWRDEPFVSLDLRVHNAHSGLDPDDPTDDVLGRMYFDALELRLPPEWVVLPAFEDPTFGPPRTETANSGDLYRVWPLVAPIEGGDLHVMPSMARFHRRYTIARRGFARRARRYLHEETLAFCRPGTSPSGRRLWSWWNPDTARYFPQNHVLPTLEHVSPAGIRAELAGDLDSIAAMVAGNAPPAWPILAPRLGWAHPWGTSHGGMVGGSEIFLYDGLRTAWSASNDGYRLMQLAHRMYGDRQPNMLYNGNGRPTRHEDWVVRHPLGPLQPVWWYNGPILYAADPFGFGSAPTFQREHVEANGLDPDYRAELESYQAIDEAHLIRFTRSPKVLLWLGNDALAREDLWTQAEGVRLTYTDLPQDHYFGIIPTGMLAARRFVDEHPGEGLPYGRGEAWGLDTMCAAYASLDDTWRARMLGWFEQVADLVQDGQADCSGIIQSTPLVNVFNGEYRCRQSIEAAITENALWSLSTTVFGDVYPEAASAVRDVLTESAYSMISPLVWSTSQHGPFALFATSWFDGSVPPFCTYIPWNGNQGNVDKYQVWSTFAYAYELTGDPVFLERAAEMLERSLVPGLFDDGLINIENRAALIALLQQGL